MTGSTSKALLLILTLAILGVPLMAQDTDHESVSPNSTHQASIGDGERHTYRIELEEFGVLTVLAEPESQAELDLSLVLSAESPYWFSVWTNQEESGAGERVQRRLPAGSYELRVQNARGEAGGDYRLELSYSRDRTWDEYEIKELGYEGIELDVEEGFSTGFVFLADVPFCEIFANPLEGDNVAIRLEVVDGEGNVVAENDDMSEGYVSLFPRTERRAYLLRVTVTEADGPARILVRMTRTGK